MAEVRQTARTTVDELVARVEIHDALLRVCRGVDRLDRELILSGYHPGARDNHGSFAGPVEEFVEWVFDNHAGKVQSCVHHLANSLIQFDEGGASVESYVLAFHRREVEGELCDLWSHGRYVDRFEERDGQWRIAERTVVLDWDRLDPVGAQFGGPLTKQLVVGSRSEEDPSYALMSGLGR